MHSMFRNPKIFSIWAISCVKPKCLQRHEEYPIKMQNKSDSTKFLMNILSKLKQISADHSNLSLVFYSRSHSFLVHRTWKLYTKRKITIARILCLINNWNNQNVTKSNTKMKTKKLKNIFAWFDDPYQYSSDSETVINSWRNLLNLLSSNFL